MDDLSVIIRELLIFKFDWPPAHVAKSFLSIFHRPTSQGSGRNEPKSYNISVIYHQGPFARQAARNGLDKD
jgi:hypothetical protein